MAGALGGPLAVRAIVDHLVYGRDGSVWACWEVEPFSIPHRPLRDAEAVHARTVGTLLALPAESLALSIVHQLPTGDIEGTDGGGGWFERRWFLAACLPDPGRSGGWRARLGAAVSEMRTGFGLAHSAPTDRTHRVHLGTALEVESALGSHLGMCRVDPAQLRWLFERAVLRGIAEPPLPSPGRSGGVGVVRLDRDTVYVEGGRPDDPDRPRHWRFMAVEHPDHGVGYQTFLCLGEMPPAWEFPYGGGEWLWHLDDQLPFGVDWALRIGRVSNQVARQRVVRARRNLVGQLAEPGSDPAGPSTTLGAAVEAVDEQRVRLEGNPALPAFRATTLVAVADRDLRELERKAGLVEGVFRSAEFNFYRPTGAQLECFTAMLPGASSPPVVREYTQDLLPGGLASGMPFGGSPLGDNHGVLLGRSLDSQYRRAVRLDPAAGPRDLDRSGSLAAIGELGSGKSFLAKTLAFHTVGMGGQVVVVDRTDRGEYRQLADVVDGTAQVVDVSGDTSLCLDPFRVFTDPVAQLRFGVGFVTLLSGTGPASTAGALCHQAAQHTIEHSSTPTLGGMVERLGGLGGEAREVAAKLDALRHLPLSRIAFDNHDGSANLDADYLCFHLPELQLPRPNTTNEDLLPEELWGRALLYLVAAYSRQVLFRDPDRFAALLLDEAHALTSNPQGRGLVGDLIRDGRKHFAAVWAFSQLPGDFTDTTRDLDSLLGYRMVFRQAASTAAQALEFVGAEARPDTTDTVTALGTGECLMRDLHGRLGLLRVGTPADPDVVAALSTTPGATEPAKSPA